MTFSTCPTDQYWANDPQNDTDELCVLCNHGEQVEEPNTGILLCESCIDQLGSLVEHREENDTEEEVFIFEGGYCVFGEFNFGSF